MIGGCIREQKKAGPKKKKSFNPARGKDLRLTTSGRMMDAILRHRHALLRAENGAAARLIAPLQQAHREIIAELAMLAARDNAIGTFSNLRRERLIVMEARIRQSLAFAEMEAIGSLNRDLRALQAREIEIQMALLRREIPAGISLDLVSPSPGRIDRILMQPLGGTRWGTRLHERYGGLVTEISGALAASVQLGEGMPEAARRLNKATDIGIRSSIAMARTEIQRVANETAYETYVVNSDVVKGIVIVETLDDRTCFAAGTGVLTHDGYVPIESLTAGSVVIGGSRRPRRVVGVRAIQKSDMARVTLSNGAVVECTAGHRWLTDGGCWVEAQDLRTHQHLAHNSSLCYDSRHEDLSDLRHDVRSKAREKEQVLRTILLSGGPKARGLQGYPCPKGSVRELRDGSSAGRASGPALLFEKVLPSRAHEAARVDLCGLREIGDGHRMVREDTEVLLPIVQVNAYAARAHQLQDVRGPVYADSGSQWQGQCCSRPNDVLPGVLLLMGEYGRRTQAEDRGCIPGREASELDGRQGRSEQPEPSWAQLVEDRAEGPQAGRGQMPGLRRHQGNQRRYASRSPHHPVPQFRHGQGGEPHVEPSNALQVLPYVGGVESKDEADRPASQDHVLVESVELYECPTLVYDIQVDVDESFIVADVVVHNCIICAALDGTFYPLGSQPSLPPFHPLCRGFASPVVRSLEEMGLNPVDFPPSTRASMNGQVPDSVDYESWFDMQSDEFQLDRLGPTRFKLFKNGDVTIPQFSMDLKVIPIDQLPMP